MSDLKAMAYVILRGNPVDGLVFYGPFSRREFASRWAQTAQVLLDHTWWIGELTLVTRATTGQILVTGKPTEGLKFYGLFVTAQAADLYGLAHFGPRGWWVCQLESPERDGQLDPSGISQTVRHPP